MGYEQGFKKGLKFTNRSVTTFPDNDWIAGVEDDENQDESEDDENQDESEDDENLENETENQNNENKMKLKMNQRWMLNMIKNNKK